MKTPPLPSNWELMPDRECKWSELLDLQVFGLATRYKDDDGNVIRGTIQFFHFPGLGIVRPCVIKHETGHSWGVKGCSKWYCLMYEGPADSLWEKTRAPLQLLYGIDYCPDCQKIIKTNMAAAGLAV